MADMDEQLIDFSNNHEIDFGHKTIAARALRRAILTASASSVLRKFFHLKNCVVEGELDLTGALLKNVLLSFSNCTFETINLSDAHVQVLRFRSCKMDRLKAHRLEVDGIFSFTHGTLCRDKIDLIGARIRGHLDLSGARLEGDRERRYAIFADRIKIDGTLFLRRGFFANSSLRFYGADIAGDLACYGGRVEAKHEALVFRASHIGGTVSLNRRYGEEDREYGAFEAIGEVNFKLAEIDDNFDCSGGQFRNFNGIDNLVALQLSQVSINGSIYMNSGFKCQGKVRLVKARVGGDVDCRGGVFSNPVPRSPKARRAASALVLFSTCIKGSLFLSDRIEADDLEGEVDTRVEGCLDLRDVKVFAFEDSPAAWPPEKITTAEHGKLRCYIFLDGFNYERILGDKLTDTKMRQDWLERQPKEEITSIFKAQPYEQLYKAFSNMGHDRVAAFFGQLKEQRRTHYQIRRDLTLGWKALLVLPLIVGLLKALYHFSYMVTVGWFMGYGYKPARLFFIFIGAWLLGGYIYASEHNLRNFAPSETIVLMDTAIASQCHQRWVRCEALPRDYLKFDPLMFSIDALMPMLDLHQKEKWQPEQAPLVFPLSLWGSRAIEIPFLSLYHFMLLQIWLGAALLLLLTAYMTGILKPRE